MAAAGGDGGLAPGFAAVADFIAPPHWRAIDFISDLHLAVETPRTFDAWAAHMANTAADAVFILGDLFEAWVGDDMRESGFEARCADVLLLASRRITIAFMVGNRDFLLGHEMLEACGMLSLSDPTRISAFGQHVLLTHGDALCLADTDYQRFRAWVRNPASQREFLARPLTERLAIGRATRHRSEQRKVDATEEAWVDLDTDATAALMRQTGVSTLIHGHTHRPGSSGALQSGFTRFVLSDWELDHAAVTRAEVLRWQVTGLTRMAPEAAQAIAGRSTAT